MQTHFVPQNMHQNLVVILRQLYYGKISFVVLVPDVFGHHSGRGVRTSCRRTLGSIVRLNST